MRALTLNITSIIIRLRLQTVGGSDKVCVCLLYTSDAADE